LTTRSEATQAASPLDRKVMPLTLWQGDCLDLMAQIPDGSVDMILCDLPYGTTACKWDTVIPFEPLWEQYKRLIKKNGAIVLFGEEPFSSVMRLSNLAGFKYDWVWDKKNTSGFVNAKLKPLKSYETICVFSDGMTANGSKNNMPYFPQGLIPYGKTVDTTRPKNLGRDNAPARKSHSAEHFQEFTNYPKQIVEFAKENAKLHPTQKPVALCEYLIKTYTNEGETVLDNTMGSGTTGVACLNTGRNFIGIEQDQKYFEIARNRIEGHNEQK